MLLIALLAAPVHAKDLHGRVGVGFNQAIGQTASLSARYWLPLPAKAPNIGFEAAVGLDTANEAFTAGARAFYVFVEEDNLNLYGAAGAAWLGGRNALRVQPGVGAEFFLFGVENLGIAAEGSVNVDLGAPTSVSTSGNLGAAVHYYF